MIKNRKVITISVVLLAFAAMYFLTRAPEEERILAVIESARSLGEIKGKEHPVERLERSKKLVDYFTEKLSFEFVFDGEHRIEIRSSEELRQRVLAGSSYFRSLELSFEKVGIEIDADMAEVEAKVGALGDIAGAEGQFFDLHLVKITLQKCDGEWKISGMKHIKNLRDESLES